jgi:hypothetical protein
MNVLWSSLVARTVAVDFIALLRSVAEAQMTQDTVPEATSTNNRGSRRHSSYAFQSKLLRNRTEAVRSSYL